ncbi:hypothetical protein BC941DRAFT_407623 [Chlamydoabsidia padenii]|nr:hypothetical protein BC941DRAFT_407623 [Chlamydoabsidia padenii]
MRKSGFEIFSNMKHIVVIGCGVIGLTTAQLLVEKGYKVTIVATWFPGDRGSNYTSPYAGAHWRTMATNAQPVLQEFDTVAYEKFLQLGRTIPEETGVMVVPSYDYYDTLTDDTQNPWFKNVVENFSFIPPENFPHSTTKVGHCYTTVLINSPQYLTWLLRQFVSKGGKLHRQTLNCITDVFNGIDTGDINGRQPVDAVVNCTGLGSLHLGGVKDTCLFPTRGQTVIIKGNHIKKTITCYDNGQISYVIPRADGTIVLGGTAQQHDYNSDVDQATIDTILDQTKNLCPELSTDDHPLVILRHAVGFRPTRKGGVRIENERYDLGNEKYLVVTHGYGHGGFGFQSSWGSSALISRLVEKGLSESRL